MDFRQHRRKLTSLLSLFVIAIRVVPQVGKARRSVISNKHWRNTIEAVRLQIGRETQRAERVGIQAGVVSIDQRGSPSEPKSRGQQHRGTDGVDLVEGDQVRVSFVRSAATGIDKIIEAVIRSRVAPLLGILSAQQILLIEAVIDSDIEFLVVTGSCSGSDPVLVWGSTGVAGGWIGKQLDHLQSHRVDKIARNTGRGLVLGWRTGITRRKSGRITARAYVLVNSVVRDRGEANGSAIIGAINAGIRIVKLPGRIVANPVHEGCARRGPVGTIPAAEL